MEPTTFSDLVRDQRSFFASGETRDILFRSRHLENLRKAIVDNEEEILAALKADLKKPRYEAYMSDIGETIHEIDFTLKNLSRWARPARAKTPLAHFPAVSYVYPEPLGVVLIIGVWNVPFDSTLGPLVGAVAAGNCAVLKPSELAPNSSRALATLVRECFDPSLVAVVEGGAEEAQSLLRERFDHIFFTGSATVARMVMEAAAKHLTPVTLELGGKNPCIVDRDADIDRTARRVAFGKFFNAGQICVGVDYLLVHQSVKTRLLEQIQRHVGEFYGADPAKSPHYARIVDEKHFHRLCRLLEEGDILLGGQSNAQELYISPTIVHNISPDDRIMGEEMMGPILPVLEYYDLAEAISIVNRLPKPLAVYLFSKSKESQERVLRETSSGGVCINDVIVHMYTSHLPFGGVGPSGMGSRNGKATFDTFSHRKSVMRRSFRFDLRVKYPPYKEDLTGLKRIMRWLL